MRYVQRYCNRCKNMKYRTTVYDNIHSGSDTFYFFFLFGLKGRVFTIFLLLPKYRCIFFFCVRCYGITINSLVLRTTKTSFYPGTGRRYHAAHSLLIRDFRYYPRCVKKCRARTLDTIVTRRQEQTFRLQFMWRQRNRLQIHR